MTQILKVCRILNCHGPVGLLVVGSFSKVRVKQKAMSNQEEGLVCYGKTYSAGEGGQGDSL